MRFLCPAFADELIGRQPLQGFEPLAEIVGRDEVGEVLAKLVVRFVVEALDGRVLDGAVHPFDLAIGPWVLRLGRAMIDIVARACKLECVRSEQFAISDCLSNHRHCRAPCTRCGEMDAIVGERCMDLVGNRGDQAMQKVTGGGSLGRLVQLDEGELAGSVDRNEHIQLALFGPNFGNVDVEVADGIGTEFAPLGLVSFNFRQPGDAVALEASVQR